MREEGAVFSTFHRVNKVAVYLLGIISAVDLPE